jgi:hypothetical protein
VDPRIGRVGHSAQRETKEPQPMSEMNRRSLLTALLGTCAAVSVVGVAATSAEAKPITGGMALPDAPAAKSEADELRENVQYWYWRRRRPRRRWVRRRWRRYW